MNEASFKVVLDDESAARQQQPQSRSERPSTSEAPDSRSPLNLSPPVVQ